MIIHGPAYAASLALLAAGLYPLVPPASAAPLVASAVVLAWLLAAVAPFVRPSGLMVCASVAVGLGVFLLPAASPSTGIAALSQGAALLLGWEAIDAQRRVAARRRKAPKEGASWVGRFVAFHARKATLLAGVAAVSVWGLERLVESLLNGSRLPRFAASAEAASFLGLWLGAVVLVAAPLVFIAAWPSLRPWRILARRVVRSMARDAHGLEPPHAASPPWKEADHDA